MQASFNPMHVPWSASPLVISASIFSITFFPFPALNRGSSGRPLDLASLIAEQKPLARRS